MPATPDNCVSLLSKMIAFDTVTHHVSGDTHAEQPLAEWLCTVAEAWGFAARWLPVKGYGPNLLVTRETDTTMPWRLFDSHLDTVGVDGMTIDPFSGILDDGKVLGRGACDTKGTGAAMLWAAKEAIAAGSLACNVAILFTVGEEHAQVGARSFVSQDLPQIDWRPEMVVVGEPTQMRVVAASNGFVRWRLATHGRAAHSSTPERGRNAIYDMARTVLAIEQQHIANLSARHSLTGRGTCSINGIRGGVQHNIVPDHCEIEIDQRLAPGESAEQALASVRQVCEAIAAEDADYQFDFNTIETAPPFASEASLALGDQLVQQLTGAGLITCVEGAPYTTNANHYAPAGLPCVVLGPGDIAQAHTKDEWVSVEQLELGVRGYRALMEASR